MVVDAFTEVVLEFLFRQVARQIWPKGQRVWQKLKEFRRSSSFFTHRTPLVNREPELRAINSALEDSNSLRVLYLTAPGGAGKTRLLEEAANLCSPKRTKIKMQLVWGGIIDLYHTDLHSVTALHAAIIRGLDPQEKFFDSYLAARKRFEQRRAQGIPVLESEREALDQHFLEDYQAFARAHRSVLAFDTLENLSYESDLIQSLCQIEDSFVVVRDWLLHRAKRLQNSVLLLAGRPQSVWRHDLETLYQDNPGAVEVVDFAGLTRRDSHRLLSLLLQEIPSISETLQEYADHLWQLANGMPVHLALIIELIAQVGLSDEALWQSSNEPAAWGRQIVNRLFDYDNHYSRLFFYLGLARKGLTTDLLHYLEPGWSETDCRQRLAEANQLSIVKTRAKYHATEEALFLHDVLYEFFDAYGPAAAQLTPWYERLAGYYRRQQVKVSRKHDQASWEQTTLSLLYYELQQSPHRAFTDSYIHWAEMAIKGHETGFDMQLREELLRFFHRPANQQQAAEQGINLGVIEQDSAVRWAKRYLARGRHQKTINVAETILALGPFSFLVENTRVYQEAVPIEQQQKAKEIFNQSAPLFWGRLLATYGEALTYTGAPETKSRSVLEQAIQSLNEEVPENEASLGWLRTRTLGRAYNTIGYLLRTLGHYADAAHFYRSALPHFRTAEALDEQADTLNNLAFLLATVGDTEKALSYINEALSLRQRLGQQHPLALSYNTRGLIYALAGQFEWGQRDCLLAYNLFQEFEAPRGIGLACNGLGFILRRRGAGWVTGRFPASEAAPFFQQADTYLQQAVTIFSKQVVEPLRLWEAHNELGSLYRDWGYRHQRQGDAANARHYFHRAVDHHMKALSITQQYNLRFQEADTCDDLAVVWAAQEEMAKANQWLQHCLELVPPAYRSAIDSGFANAPQQGEAYWLILGKIHLQQGIWTLRPSGLKSTIDNPTGDNIKTGIEHFCLAAIFFERYWPGTEALNGKLEDMARYVDRIGASIDNALDIVNQVATRYSVDLAPFLNVIKSK